MIVYFKGFHIKDQTPVWLSLYNINITLNTLNMLFLIDPIPSGGG